MKKIILSLVVVGLIGVTAVHGEETVNLKPKSVGWAIGLGLDPIPGDALFYAGKPVQGWTNMFVGTIGGLIFSGGLIGGIDCKPESNGDDLCTGYDALIIAGAILYFPMLIWDAFGGVAAVEEHNKKVAAQTTWLQTIQPTLAVTDKGAMAGLQIKF